jgi:tetratricopeptide (TPR) repeat protein
LAKRPRIVFTAIVKNESRVIRRCLESVKPFIDAWSISDTGSTDGTQDAIREILKDIPGKLIERPWVDFATNRNEAIEAGLEFEPDYFLTLDADEELTLQPGFSLAGLSSDCYQANFQITGTSGKWPRNLLFRPDIRYRYVLDETLNLIDRRVEILPACLVLSYNEGSRSADGLVVKHARDCEVLRRALEKEPNEPRYWYYLAMRLFGAQKFEEAIGAYERRIALDCGLQAERSYSQMMIGQCLELLGRPFEEIQAAYLAAFQANPRRAEPIYALGCVHSKRGEHALAELYARAAQRITRPTDPMPVDETVYAYRAVELLAGSIAEQGRLGEAANLLEKLILLPQLPAEEHERVKENIALLRREESAPAEAPKLGPDEGVYESQAGALRNNGLRAFRRMGLEYLASFNAQALPSPIRWLWIMLVALFGRWPVVASAILSVPLAIWATLPLAKFQPLALLAVAASPLLFLAGRRRLQDASVAALTLAALGFALRGNAAGAGIALFALLAVKEAAVLTIPALGIAWVYGHGSWTHFGVATGAACAAWFVSLLVLFGSMALPMLRAGAKGHETPYTKDHQQGPWHRLVVDLVLVSPVTTLAALFGPWKLLLVAGFILAAHAVAPVRNVRLIIAADLLLRVCAVAAFGWWILPALAVDLYISRKLRAVYDPVTAALTSQLGMAR